MKFRRSWGMYAIAMAICMTAVIAVGAAEALKARPTAVAAVDVEKVFSSLREKGEIESSLSREKEKLNTEMDAKKQELTDLETALGILNVGSPDFKKKQNELGQKTFEFKAWGEWQQNKLQREAGLQFGRLYVKFLAAVAKVAKDNGYDMVVYKEAPPDFSNIKAAEEIGAMIQNRKILYAADDLDLTDQISQFMNNEYSDQMGNTAPATQPSTPGMPGAK